MISGLRNLCIFAVLASSIVNGLPRAFGEDETENDSPPASASKVEKRESRQNGASGTPIREGSKPLLPDPESLIPRFEPDGEEPSFPDTGYTPPRWLDQNDQFLYEGDEYPPGYDPYRERPGIPI